MRRTTSSSAPTTPSGSSFPDLTALLHNTPFPSAKGYGGASSGQGPGQGPGSTSSGSSSPSGFSSKRLILVSNSLPVVVASKRCVNLSPSSSVSQASCGYALDKDALLLQAKAGLQGYKVIFVGQLPSADAISEKDRDKMGAMLLETLSCFPVFLEADVKRRYYDKFCKRILWPLMHYSLPLHNFPNLPRTPPSSGLTTPRAFTNTGGGDGEQYHSSSSFRAGGGSGSTSEADNPEKESNRFNKEDWNGYMAANKAFADVIMEVVIPDEDLIWIHDYHLLTLPSLMRKRFYSIRMGFFLHCPFPSSEVFRAIPVREELLRSLLNADLVGFHTFDYARHFLSCCSRLLGLEYATGGGGINVRYYGRKVNIKISPTGVDVDRLGHVLTLNDCEWRRGELRALFDGRIVLAGVDDMDLFKGIDLKLQAFELLLSAHPWLKSKIVMVQVANPPKSSSREVSALVKHVRDLASRINAAHSDASKGDKGKVLHMWERPVPLYERAALYAETDVAIVAATRDGMNLVPYEYITCRERGQRKASERGSDGGEIAGVTVVGTDGIGSSGLGVSGGSGSGGDAAANSSKPMSTLLVSEFVGCSPSLSGAVRINPWNIEHVCDAMYDAISMKKEEKAIRHSRHWQYVRRHTVSFWARNFVEDLQRCCARHAELYCYGLGFGLGFRVVAMDPNFRRLDTSILIPAYRDARTRVILLDYDGTIVPSARLTLGPQQDLIDSIAKLCSDKRNFVYIMSGRSVGQLHSWFGGVRRLGIIAEHGYFVRHFDAKPDAEFECIFDAKNVDTTWQHTVLPILELYTDATDGSFIEKKESALVWHYRDADPDFGLWQAKDLSDHLEGVLAHERIQVSRGQFYVEVNPQGVHKGAASEMVVDKVSGLGREAIDFVFCVGDEQSDEAMFASVEGLTFSPHMPAEVIACTVGQKPSRAKYYLNDSREVMEMIRAAIGSTANTRQSATTPLTSPRSPASPSSVAGGTPTLSVRVLNEGDGSASNEERAFDGLGDLNINEHHHDDE